MIADADVPQQSPVDRHKEARFPARHAERHGRGFLIDGHHGAAEQYYFCGSFRGSEPCQGPVQGQQHEKQKGRAHVLYYTEGPSPVKVRTFSQK